MTSAPFAPGTIRAPPQCALCGVVALVWWIGKGIAFWFPGRYYDLLPQVAHEPLGAF